MANQDLINYINQAKAEGKSEQQIKEELLKVGWQVKDIDEAFSNKLDAVAIPIVSGSNSETTPKTPIIKIAVIAISVILLIGGSAGAFYYADKQFNWGIVTSKKVVELSTPTSALKISVIPQNNKKDCGVIDMTVDKTNQTQAATDCINSSIISCTLAGVRLIGTGITTLEIFGKDNNNCIIEQKIITPAPEPSVPAGYPTFEYYSICKFPMDTFIDALVQSFKKQGASTDMLFMGLSFIKGIENAQIVDDGWYPNKVSGLIPGRDTLYKCK